MRRRLDRAPALKPIPATAAERRRMDALLEVAQALSRDPRFRHSPLAVKGGTALALAYGLPRPSLDLDLTCAGRVDKAKVLEAAAEALARKRGRRFSRADIKQRGRGHLRLEWEEPGDGGKAAQVRTSIDVLSEDPLAVPANTVERNGFRAFTLPVMAETKLRTLAGEQPRMRARDLYDAAWLMENHMEAVAPATRLRLWERLEGDIMDRIGEWAELFVEDEIMLRSNVDQVWDSLSASLGCDPVVMQRRDPGGALSLEAGGDGVALYFRGEVLGAEPVGTFASAADARAWVEAADPEGALSWGNGPGPKPPQGAAGPHPQA